MTPLFPYITWLLIIVMGAAGSGFVGRKILVLLLLVPLILSVIDAVSIVGGQLIIPYSLSMLPLIYNLALSPIVMIDPLSAVFIVLSIVVYLVELLRGGENAVLMGLAVLAAILFSSTQDLLVLSSAIGITFLTLHKRLPGLRGEAKYYIIGLPATAYLLTGNSSMIYMSSIFLQDVIGRGLYGVYFAFTISSLIVLAMYVGGLYPLGSGEVDRARLVIYTGLLVAIARIHYTYIVDPVMQGYYGYLYIFIGFLGIYAALLKYTDIREGASMMWRSLPWIIMGIGGDFSSSLIMLWVIIALCEESVVGIWRWYARNIELSWIGIPPLPGFALWGLSLILMGSHNPIVLITVLLPFLIRASTGVPYITDRLFLRNSLIMGFTALLILLIYYSYFIPFSHYFTNYRIYRNITVW